MHRQRPPIDEFRARLRERALVRPGKSFVELAGEGELEHGVAQKFQPSVVLHRHALFVRDGRMRERQPQEALVAKHVSQSVLEDSEVGHGERDFD